MILSHREMRRGPMANYCNVFSGGAQCRFVIGPLQKTLMSCNALMGKLTVMCFPEDESIVAYCRCATLTFSDPIERPLIKSFDSPLCIICLFDICLLA